MNPLSPHQTLWVVVILSVVMSLLLLASMGIFKIGHVTALFAGKKTSVPKTPLTFWTILKRGVLIFFALQAVALVAMMFLPKSILKKGMTTVEDEKFRSYNVVWKYENGTTETHTKVKIERFDDSYIFATSTSPTHGITEYKWQRKIDRGDWSQLYRNGEFKLFFDSQELTPDRPRKMGLKVSKSTGPMLLEYADVIFEATD